ncbi:prepilin peptidase [Adlercreutzia sp. ZJ141]|uniref:prepilin peptidase n=1 Tax=Adlercreutzia sp. ZJ141 TaxID=2709406 RepID=UPI0013EB8526|nr:prepilin peptidase [Adlercreutzia sp. ZJ141]
MSVGDTLLALAPAFGLVVLFAAAVVLVVLAVEDVRRKTVPGGRCFVFVALCAVFQACCGGASSLCAGALWAVACIAFWVAVNAVARRHTADRCAVALGEGDVICMVGLCLASGFDAPMGFACCFAVAGAFSLAGLATKRLRLGDTLPLIPFFCCWFAYAAFQVIV